jgi:hypothetical protein
MPYVVAQKEVETPKAFRKRVYDKMYMLSRAGREQQKMRVVKQNRATAWNYVWANLHDAWTAETITAVWYEYVVIHDIIPTNVRVHNIRLADTPNCKECGGLDTSIHRPIKCGEGRNILE